MCGGGCHLHGCTAQPRRSPSQQRRPLITRLVSSLCLRLATQAAASLASAGSDSCTSHGSAWLLASFTITIPDHHMTGAQLTCSSPGSSLACLASAPVIPTAHRRPRAALLPARAQLLGGDTGHTQAIGTGSRRRLATIACRSTLTFPRHRPQLHLPFQLARPCPCSLRAGGCKHHLKLNAGGCSTRRCARRTGGLATPSVIPPNLRRPLLASFPARSRPGQLCSGFTGGHILFASLPALCSQLLVHPTCCSHPHLAWRSALRASRRAP